MNILNHIEEKKILKKYLPFIINIFFFFFIALLTHSLYRSDDDTFIAYLLGGGFGEQPTELLHYNHIMHPILGLILKILFLINTNTNWYSLLLFAGNFVAFTVIFYQLLKIYGIPQSFVIYVVIVLLFGCCWTLTQVNFTNTAIALTIAGIVCIGSEPSQNNSPRTRLISGALLLILASLFRIHILIPLIGVCLPFIFLLSSRKQVFTILSTLLITAIIIVSLNFFHTSFYSARIPGWRSEENYRQLFFKYVNHSMNVLEIPGQAKWTTETNLLNNGLLVDTSFLSKEKLQRIMNDIQEYKHSNAAPVTINKWFFISNRIFFFSLFAFGLFIYKNKKGLLAAILSIVCSIGGILLLAIYAKLPAYLLPSVCFLITLLMITKAGPAQQSGIRVTAIKITSLSLLLIWAGIRSYKINSHNKIANENFKTAYHDLAAHGDMLFIVTDDNFPLNDFYIWDAPKRYLLKNLIYKENLLNDTYQQILQRFNIDNLGQVVAKPNILFWGDKSPGLATYFHDQTGKNIIISDYLPNFKSKVYTMSVRP